MKLLLLFVTTLLLVLMVGCSDKDEREKASGMSAGMKCGAGKCGANMFDGNAAVAKKKANIIKQMQENDPRSECVMRAETSKEVYDCVRDPETGKLSKSFSGEPSESSGMKCGAGKCGTSMTKPESEKVPTMKCGVGKCGSM